MRKICTGKLLTAVDSLGARWGIGFQCPILLVSALLESDTTERLSLSLFTYHALEKEMAAHSSVLAWRIPGTGEPGGLPSVGLCRVGHD